MMLAFAAGLFSACQDLDETKVYAPEDVVAPVLHDMEPITITSENMGDPVVFSWDGADYGVKTGIDYSVEASYNGGPRVVLYTGIATTSTEQTYEDLNGRLFLGADSGGVGVPADTPSDVDFYVSSTIGTGQPKIYSAPVTINVTVTAAERVYPQIWVIGDYCAWSFDNSQFLFSFAGDEVLYEGVIDFGAKAANGFKISGVGAWDDTVNWGTDGVTTPEPEAASIQLIASGGSGNIAAYSKRFYRFAFDRGTLVLTKGLAFDQLGIVGDGAGSWDVDVVMDFDPIKQRFWADATLVAGQIKFRVDGAWDTSFGSNVEGKLNSADNITVPAGNYRIYVNLNNPLDQTYELNAADYGTGGGEPEPVRADWYYYGAAVAHEGWNEIEMTKASDGIYKAAGIEVAAASGFLFRSGDQSTYVGPDISLGASPYTVTIGTGFAASTNKIDGNVADAGTYDYWYVPVLNRAYVMNVDALPEYVDDSWGVVGTLTGWGAMGDLSMSAENGMFVCRGVALTTASEFKVRFDFDWNGTDKGMASADPVGIDTAIPTGGNNIKITADGTYDIWFDETNSLIYVMTAGTTPQ